MTGTLGGATFQVGDAFSTIDPNKFPLVLITNYANACAVWESNANVASSAFLLFTFNAVFSTGTFTVVRGGAGAPPSVEVDYNAVDPTCSGGPYELGISGSVTVTNADACQVAGTFDVMLGDGNPPTWSDHITGSFVAPRCISPPPPPDAGPYGCQQGDQ